MYFKKYLQVSLVLMLLAALLCGIVTYVNNLKSFEVVVARYNENVDWIAKEFPHVK
jgi:hypothetical protein